MSIINLPTYEQFDAQNTLLASIAAHIEPAYIVNDLTTGGTTVPLSAEQGKELKADIGNQTYTEDNYITDSEPLTESVDKLDMAVKDNADLVDTNMTDLAEHKLDYASQMDTLTTQSGVNSAKLVKLPSDFAPSLPCNFYRYNNGYTMHDMNFNQYKNGTKIYVSDTGNDTTGNGSQSTPFRTMKKALETARDGADSAYMIITDSAMFGRYQLNFNTTFVNKTIAIVSINPMGTIFCVNDNYTWTLDGAGTYKCSRSGVTGVIDVNNRDVHSVPVPLIKKADLATCQSTAGTWYTDDTYLWVHRVDGVIPTYNSTIVNMGADDFDPILNNSKLYCENIIFAGFSANSLRIRTTSYVGTEACFRDCKFVSGHPTSGNCVAINDLYRTYMFNCIASYGQFDGFNYHFINVPVADRRSCLVLEYNCIAYHHGIEYAGTGSNNASTCHEGVSTVRFGTVGYYTTTPVIVDINGCYSILYDCESENPVNGGVEGSGECYRFSKDSGANRSKAILINCKAKKCTTAIYGDEGVDLILSRFDYDGTINNAGTLTYQ